MKFRFFYTLFFLSRHLPDYCRYVCRASLLPIHILLLQHTQRVNLNPIHTADADATQLSSCIEFATSWRQSRQVWTNLPTTKSSCVVLAVWTHPSAVVTQFPIFCAVQPVTIRPMSARNKVEQLCRSTLSRNKFAYSNCQFSIGKQSPNKHGF